MRRRSCDYFYKACDLEEMTSLDKKRYEYLNEYAKDIKSLKTPILFRINNEMNGDWCGYSAYHYAKDAELYRESWRYIYKIFNILKRSQRNLITNIYL